MTIYNVSDEDEDEYDYMPLPIRGGQQGWRIRVSKGIYSWFSLNPLFSCPNHPAPHPDDIFAPSRTYRKGPQPQSKYFGNKPVYRLLGQCDGCKGGTLKCKQIGRDFAVENSNWEEVELVDGDYVLKRVEEGKGLEQAVSLAQSGREDASPRQPNTRSNPLIRPILPTEKQPGPQTQSEPSNKPSSAFPFTDLSASNINETVDNFANQIEPFQFAGKQTLESALPFVKEVIGEQVAQSHMEWSSAMKKVLKSYLSVKSELESKGLEVDRAKVGMKKAVSAKEDILMKLCQVEAELLEAKEVIAGKNSTLEASQVELDKVRVQVNQLKSNLDFSVSDAARSKKDLEESQKIVSDLTRRNQEMQADLDRRPQAIIISDSDSDNSSSDSNSRSSSEPQANFKRNKHTTYFTDLALSDDGEIRRQTKKGVKTDGVVFYYENSGWIQNILGWYTCTKFRCLTCWELNIPCVTRYTPQINLKPNRQEIQYLDSRGNFEDDYEKGGYVLFRTSACSFCTTELGQSCPLMHFDLVLSPEKEIFLIERGKFGKGLIPQSEFQECQEAFRKLNIEERKRKGLKKVPTLEEERNKRFIALYQRVEPYRRKFMENYDPNRDPLNRPDGRFLTGRGVTKELGIYLSDRGFENDSGEEDGQSPPSSPAPPRSPPSEMAIDPPSPPIQLATPSAAPAASAPSASSDETVACPPASAPSRETIIARYLAAKAQADEAEREYKRLLATVQEMRESGATNPAIRAATIESLEIEREIELHED